MVFISDSNKCLICRLLVDVKSWDETNIILGTTAAFTTWKVECSTAICRVLFGKNIDSIVSYFQKANYCSRCEQLVRDLSFVWKQLQSFKNQMRDLSAKISNLIDLNYQMIEEKSLPEVTQQRIALLLDTTVEMKIPDYSYEETVEIIYSVLPSTLKPDLEACSSSNTSFTNNVVIHPDSVTFETIDDNDPAEHFDITNKMKKEYSDTENYLQEDAVVAQLYKEDPDSKPNIKSENCDSFLDGCKKKVEGSNFENHDDSPVNKLTDDDSNSSNEYEMRKKKLRRNRSTLKLNGKLKKKILKPYYCEEEGCTRRFTCEANKQFHIRKVHKGESKPCTCLQCGRKFTNSEHLARHVNNVHEEGRVSRTINCKFCGTKYIEPEDLTAHYSASHQEANPFQCAFCPELFLNSLELTKHTKQCHPQSNVCKICEGVFINPSFLNIHEAKAHKGKAVWPECSMCGQKFACQASLNVHLKAHSQSKLFKCEVCQIEFKWLSQLKSHSDLHIEGVFTCTICETVLSNLYDLKTHEATHNPKPTVTNKRKGPKKCVNRPPTKRKTKLKVQPINYDFECKFCGKGYFQEEELNGHYAEAHLGPNPFSCAFCPHACSNSIDLTSHMKSAHPDPNLAIGKLKCNTCGGYFANPQSLWVHKRSHVDPSLLKLKCHLCPAVFKHPYLLKSHVETHIGERKYVCDKCGKAYNRSDCLYKHSKTHDERQRKYPCKVCDKKFFTNTQCKNHEKCHTNIKEFVCQFCGKSFNRDCNLSEHLKIHAGVPTRRRPKSKFKSVSADHTPQDSTDNVM